MGNIQVRIKATPDEVTRQWMRLTGFQKTLVGIAKNLNKNLIVTVSSIGTMNLMTDLEVES